MATKTNLLNNVRKSPASQQAFTALVKYCFPEARQIAARRVSQELQKLVLPTAVANKALPCAIEQIRCTPADAEITGDDFTKLLTKIIRNIAIDEIRQTKTKARSPGHELEQVHGAVVGPAPDPGDCVSAGELGTKFAEIALDVGPNVNDPEIKRLVHVLGGLAGYEPKTIYAVLLASGFTPPSISTIARWIREFRERVKREIDSQLEDE